jgi:hypothetical protein
MHQIRTAPVPMHEPHARCPQHVRRLIQKAASASFAQVAEKLPRDSAIIANAYFATLTRRRISDKYLLDKYFTGLSAGKSNHAGTKPPAFQLLRKVSEALAIAGSIPCGTPRRAALMLIHPGITQTVWPLFLAAPFLTRAVKFHS